MAVTALNTTTLTNALNAMDLTFLVTSNSNIAVGDSIVIGQEQMLVYAKLGTTQITVQRGQNGTSGRAHTAGAQVYGGFTSGILTAVKDGLGGTRLQFTDVPVGSLPQYYLPLGTRVRDELGNEFVLCDFNTTMYKGQPCSISAVFLADALATTGRGNVGVVAETGASTSDQWGWVQVFGRCLILLGMAGVSPSDAANGPTTVSTSAATKFQLATSLTSPNGIGFTTDPSTAVTNSGYYVQGITVATDASPADVSKSPSLGFGVDPGYIAVVLNYPRIEYLDTGALTS